jgi:hypothetical protein
MSTDEQAAEIGKLLKQAGARHPWPDEIATHWGKGAKTPLIKVQPRLVVEVAADAALQAGHYRSAATSPSQARVLGLRQPAGRG